MEEQIQPLISKISTVVPATSRGDENTVCQLSHMDLLLKLHYIRAVYFFINDAAQSFSIYDLKEPMFPLLDHFAHLSGRIRISDSGRPFIKCNDAGVRIAESYRDDVTLEEWFQQKGCSTEELVHDHVLGPDLGFSPLAFVKFTWFKCGGLCVGLSWSHVLGDVFSAFNFITKWSQILAGHTHMAPKSLPLKNHKQTNFQHNSLSRKPISVQKAKTVEEHWLIANDTKTVTHTFRVTSKQLNHLVTTTFPCGENQTATDNTTFEILSALVWKYIARIRGDSEPKVVTICTYDGREIDDDPSNGLVLSIVEANVVVAKSDVSDLAKMIAEEKKVENVEKLFEENEGTEDFVVYGANLTFVDLENAKIYEAKLNGEKPVVVNCSIHSVGNQGVVLVLPAPEDDEGRMITISLPENELKQLKDKMDGEWGIASLPH